MGCFEPIWTPSEPCSTMETLPSSSWGINLKAARERRDLLHKQCFISSFFASSDDSALGTRYSASTNGCRSPSVRSKPLKPWKGYITTAAQQQLAQSNLLSSSLSSKTSPLSFQITSSDITPKSNLERHTVQGVRYKSRDPSLDTVDTIADASIRTGGACVPKFSPPSTFQ